MKVLTVADLKKAIADLPDDMPVAINETCAEATGLARSVTVINGGDDKERPYDKGDDIWYRARRFRADPSDIIKLDTKVCFINS
jgi:hypothetical protein